MKQCRLYYYFGQHETLIDVPFYEFEKVIDDLSSEFEIVKDFDSWDSIKDPGLKCVQTFYFLIDYLGNKVKLGDSFERILIDDFKA